MRVPNITVSVIRASAGLGAVAELVFAVGAGSAVLPDGTTRVDGL
jgi:hypothetical protein